MILLHFCVMNWFSEMIWETIKCYILNSILELDNECFIWIQLLNLIIEDALEFDYVFDSYCMQCIRIKVISSINFLSCTTSCILQRHHNLTLNKKKFFEAFMKFTCFFILCCIFFIIFLSLIMISHTSWMSQSWFLKLFKFCLI